MEADKLIENDVFSRKSYLTVIRNGVDVDGQVCTLVRNEHNAVFYVPHRVLDKENCDSASQFNIEKKASRTQIVKAIRNAGDSVFTVNFNKKVDPKHVKEAIMTLYANSHGKLISKVEFEKKAKEVEEQVKKGEERTMICRLCDVDDEFGMFQVVDLEEPYEPRMLADGSGVYDNRWRQVIQLNINWAIVKGIKYVADGKKP